MCNTTIAKTQLRKLERRTKIDLYHLQYEDIPYTPLTENILNKVKEICKQNNIICPLYKWNGEIKFKRDLKDFYDILNYLASEFNIVFNLKEIQKNLYN
jgi:hypothetical protein